MKGIYNVRLITEAEILDKMAVLYDKTITSIIPENELEKYQLEELIDGNGGYLAPGFIDVHIHGCFGHDTMDAGTDTMNNISKTIVRTGVTSFLATTMTMDMDKIKYALSNIRENLGKVEGAEILGCHLEGPFISRKYRGAQDDTYITNPSFDDIREFSDVIRIITLAPENEGSIEFIRECRRNNIVVSIGHSNATYEEAMEAIAAGAGHITHTYNAMTSLHHRNPGVVGAAMLSDASCELIVDNIHVHPAAQEILLRMKGTDKIVLITDAMRACLMEEGTYDLGGHEVTVKDSEARMANGALAGSVLTIDKAIRNFRKNQGIDIRSIVNMASMNPARVLGIENIKGSIDTGKDADMVIFNEDIEISHTFVGGKLLYRR